jgi:hypothetical protein
MKSKKLNWRMRLALENINESKKRYYAEYFCFDYCIVETSKGDEFVEFAIIRRWESCPMCLNLSTINDFRKDLGVREAQICFDKQTVNFYP